MDPEGHRDRIAGCRHPAGPERRALSVGGHTWVLSGLSDPLARALDRRWGPFVSADPTRQGTAVAVVDAGSGGWLSPASSGEPYRLEALPGGRPAIVSYRFALAEADDGWRLALSAPADEPPDRTVENAVRWLIARWTIDAGGIPLHGAGLERGGRGWVFAGPSNAGKTTALSLSAGARSLGDDFAAVVPCADRWGIVALPFDNTERIDESPPEEPVPLAAVVRLHQAPEHRLERPARGLAAAALLGCAAFPWALSDLAAPLLEHADALAATGRVVSLHFRRDAGFWELLDRLD